MVKKLSDPEFWLTIVQTVGIPTALLFVGLWYFVPPVVEGHIEFLHQTTKTLQSINSALESTNVTMNEMLSVQRLNKDFMEQVMNDHKQQQKSLDIILNKIDIGN